MDKPLSNDIALRIGLAARVLPDISPARLIRVLADAIGLPPTADKLASLRLKDLKTAANGDLEDLDLDALKTALALLKGEGIAATDPPPALEPVSEGMMPASIRVACASNGGEVLDGHFGSARRFLVYQVSADGVRLIDARDVEDGKAADKTAYRAHLIRDCRLLYVASIGGPAAAKVVKADIHPIQDAAGGSARARLTNLQRILADKPPPWLAKVMGHAPEARIRFERALEMEA